MANSLEALQAKAAGAADVRGQTGVLLLPEIRCAGAPVGDGSFVIEQPSSGLLGMCQFDG